MAAFDVLARAVDLAFTNPKVLVPWILMVVLGLGASVAGVPSAGREASDVNVPFLVLYAVVSSVFLAWASAATLAFLTPADHSGDHALANALREGLRRTPSLLVLYLLLLLLFGLAVGVPAALVALIASASLGLGVLLGVVATLWMLFLAVRLSLAEAALVLDGLPPSDAIGAAWSESHGGFLSILGLLILLWIVGFLLSLFGWIPGVGVFLSSLAWAFSSYLITAALGFAYLELRGDRSISGGSARPPGRPWDEASPSGTNTGP